ncbi:MAG: tetratricopeptide repeat protein [Pseudomonadota bacterium]
MDRKLIVASILALMGVGACAGQDVWSPAAHAEPQADRDTSADTAPDRPAIVAALSGAYDVSDAALATAVRGPEGLPVGIQAYPTPRAAIEAGDMAAFVSLMRLAVEVGEAPDGIGAFVLAIDRVADGDFSAARSLLADDNDTPLGLQLQVFTEAWLLAMDADMSGAISTQRKASSGLPGLTGDLSLAAMLEASGREEEALAVYASMTPSRIEAPEHEFDPKGLIFTHVQMVISRRTLLLYRLGRIEDAKAVYQALAEAEPERAVFYAAALESLDTGRGIDVEPLTMQAAFARSISDLSLAFYQQRLIRNAMMGRRTRGFDEQRATFDQLALLMDPESESLREIVVGTLANEALYAGAAHTAMTAPEPTAGLQIAAAQSLLMSGNADAARAAIAQGISISDEDDRLSVYSGAIGLHALMGDEAEALRLSDQAIGLVTNPAEQAGFYGLKASILQQFGRYGDAVEFASRARELDDTHDRRMALANVMGEAGMIDGAIRILQIERLKRPDDPYMLNTYGYFLLQHTERFSEAYKVLYLANGLANNNPYIADSLGWAYFKLGHLDDAKRLIELARRELAPQKHWEIEDHMGDIHWYLGDRDAARDAWAAALGEFPPDSVREAIERKLDKGLTEPMPETQPLPRIETDPDDLEPQET